MTGPIPRQHLKNRPSSLKTDQPETKRRLNQQYPRKADVETQAA
jgi:hypothetical protein